jgi:hypothetical protein
MREIRLTIETREGGNRGAWELRTRHDLGLPNGHLNEADAAWLELWLRGVDEITRRWANLPPDKAGPAAGGESGGPGEPGG